LGNDAEITIELHNWFVIDKVYDFTSVFFDDLIELLIISEFQEIKLFSGLSKAIDEIVSIWKFYD